MRGFSRSADLIGFSKLVMVSILPFPSSYVTRTDNLPPISVSSILNVLLSGFVVTPLGSLSRTEPLNIHSIFVNFTIPSGSVTPEKSAVISPQGLKSPDKITAPPGGLFVGIASSILLYTVPSEAVSAATLTAASLDVISTELTPV